MRTDVNEMIAIPARLDDVVEDSLRQVGKIYRRKLVKRAGATCGSLLAVVGALLIFGFANPALAAEFPLIGSLFKNVSQKTGSIPTHLEEYGVVQTVDAAAAGDFAFHATKVYSDGYTAQIAMEFTTPEDMTAKPEYFQATGENTATVNGTDARVKNVSLFTYVDGRWIGAANILVPEEERDKDTLEISLTMPSVEGCGKTGADGVAEAGSYELAVTVPVDKAHEHGFISDAVDNGAKVLEVLATPAMTRITVEKPYWGDASPSPEDGSIGNPILILEDGSVMERDFSATVDLGGYDRSSRETQVADLYFDGLPAGTGSFTLRFEKCSYDREIYAEFVIDLAAETVTPGNTPAKEVVTYDQEGIIGLGHGEEQNGFSVSFVEIYKAQGSAQIDLTPCQWRVDDPCRITVELYNADGDLLGETVSVVTTPLGEERLNSQWGMGWGGEYLQSLHPVFDLHDAEAAGNLPQAGDQVTTVIKDQDSGEVLLTDTRVLE